MQSVQHQYDADYFLRGPSSGKSNYENYRWMEERTMAYATRLMRVMGIRPGDSLLDVGAAMGFTVKALRRLGVDAAGYDISEWAVSHCDPEVKDFMATALPDFKFDFVHSKDCLEHVPRSELRPLIMTMIRMASRGILIIVPLSAFFDEPYVRDEDNKDSTHVIRAPLDWWMREVLACIGERDDWIVRGSYHIPGLKPTSLTHLYSCGFIEAVRV